jgi:transposase
VVVYVSTPVDICMRVEVGPGAGEPPRSEPASRRTELAKGSGADRSPLLPVGLEPGRKRPCERTVSLRAKRDDREHPIRNAPALIAGEIIDLDVAINLGGAVHPNMNPSAPMQKTTCGLDVASTSAYACVQAADGTIRHELTLPATRAGEDRLLALLPPGTAVFLESTGRYHWSWARRLAAAGHHVYVLNALLAKRLIGATNALRQNKTDKIDARQLADIGRRDGASLQTYLFREDPARLRLRTLCEVRTKQRQLLTDTLKSAAGLLQAMLPEAPWLKLAENRGLATLFLQVDSLARLQRMRLPTLQTYACGKAEALHAVLRQPLSTAAVFDALLPALQAQLQLIESLREQQIALVAQIRQAVVAAHREAEVELVQTIPGYGPKTAPTIVACLPEDLRQWGPKQKVARKVQAYFGCDPKLKESGKWKGQVRMSKRGIELARTALFQAATCAMLHDPDMKAVFDRKKAEGKFYLVAVSHVMRLQLRRLVAVLYDRKPFVRRPENISAAA